MDSAVKAMATRQRTMIGLSVMAGGVLVVAAAHAGVLAALTGRPADWAAMHFSTAAMLWAGGALTACTGCVMWLRGTSISAAPADGAMDHCSRGRRMLLHLSPCAAYLGMPMGHLLGPVVVWRLSPAPDGSGGQEARALVEFQLTITVFAVAALMLCALLVGFFLLAALIVCHFASIVLAVLQTLRCRPVRMPLIVPFLR